MADLLAPGSLALRRRSTLEVLAMDPALELGAGGEARVLALAGADTLVAKLYHEPTMAKARKVALMMDEPPELDAAAATLAWPCDLLFDGRGTFAGFLMPRAEGPRLFEFYNPVTRRQTAPLCDYAFLHQVAANLAATFEALHARGYVIGDVNESNVLVRDDARVTLVDTDSMQVRDPEDGTIHRSRVGKPEFTPPELQGRTFADFDRTEEHDRFGLAVLVFLLLMEGTHPFAGRLVDGTETPPVEERIRRGLFPHHGHAEIDPPRLAPEFTLLDPALRALFVRAFADGHADPAARPSAAEWRAALSECAAALVVCEESPRHRHGAHLRDCPWCARTAVLRGRDPFPADAPAPRPRPKAVRPHAPRALAAPVQKPLVPVAKPVLAPPFAATSPRASKTSTLATLSSNAPAPLSGEEWLEQAMGRMGVLHPGAWVLPSLVLMFGPPGLVVLGMIAFPIVLILGLMRMGEQHPEPRLPGTFAVPAVVLMLLALWLSSALGGSWMGASGADGGPGAGQIPIRLEGSSRAPWQVRVSEPVAEGGTRLVHLQNDLAVEREIRGAYAGTPGGEADTVRLAVYVLPDGSVDPERIATTDATDPWLADAAVTAAREMRFTFLASDGTPAEGWVWMDVTFGP
ncbi:MAG TPA: hypothetical protein VFR81_06995 [Longimicrobium sp.]|nr:hypothetical protein [Longimicrobium sp.]